MVLAFILPDKYGYVVLSSIVLPFVTSSLMGGNVMKARDVCSVPLPNAYGTPGFHKKADEFNRWQRGHQSFFETITIVTAAALVGGLKYPIFVASGATLHCIGAMLFQLGYGDETLPVESARYKKGGVVKHVGTLLILGACISQAGTLNGWWK